VKVVEGMNVVSRQLCSHGRFRGRSFKGFQLLSILFSPNIVPTVSVYTLLHAISP